MKVVYRQTMLDRIRAARVAAEIEQREIEKIILTVAETRRLLDEVGFAVPRRECWYSDFEAWLYAAEHCYAHPGPQPRFAVLGIDIEVSR